MKDNEKQLLIKQFMSEIKTEDILNVGFMGPIELALRTHHTDKSVPADTLPQGLMYAVKDSINNNKYKLQNLKQIDPNNTSFDELKKNHQDNFLSLLKKPSGTELAICVCMYSQDKPMLKRTLAGISQNINTLIDTGINPDDIFLMVVIDGIQKVDPSLFDYFEEFQRVSEIFVEEDEKQTLKKKYQQFQYKMDQQEETTMNFSKHLFMAEEFQNRVQRKFINVRTKYDQVYRIKNQIQNIKKQQNSDNKNLKMILSKLIDKQKNLLKSVSGEDNIDQKIKISEQTIMKSLASSEQQCNQYISTRDALAYISSYRLPTSSFAPMEDPDQPQIIEEEEESTLSQNTEANASLLDKTQNSNESKPKKRNIHYINMFICIKYKNSGKLSSHNWFFNGFCHELKPKYAILLDVGLRPYPDAIVKMYRYMKNDPKVGGVCGYMSLKAEKVQQEEEANEEDIDCLSSMLRKIFDIQKAQQIEYHFAHLIDKPFESLFKFIHVLPGAFSGYSMSALRPKDKGDVLLKQYFKSIDEKLANNKVVNTTLTASDIMMRIFLPKAIWSMIKQVNPDSQQQVLYNENIYLAEDRILCMGIHKNEKDIMFMPDAYAEVDPIKTVHGMMGQRKRWINGSSFSFEKVQKELSKSENSKGLNQFFLRFQIFYLNTMNFLVYFSPSLLLFTFHLTMETIRIDYLGSILSLETKGIGNVIYNTFTNIIDFIYALILGGIIFFSLHLTNNNKRYIYYIYLFSSLFGIFALVTFLIFFIDVIKSFAGSDATLRVQYQLRLDALLPGVGKLVDLLRYFIISSMGLYVFPLLLYALFFKRIKFLWQIITGTFSFIFYSPSYLNLLNIYAMCRIDDISWGTKGLDSSVGGKNALLKQSWKVVKIIDVSKFFIWNVIISGLLLSFDSYLLVKFFVTLVLLIVFTLIQSVKMILAVVYLIKYKIYLIQHPLDKPIPNTPQDLRNSKNIQKDTDNINNNDSDYQQNAQVNETNRKTIQKSTEQQSQTNEIKLISEERIKRVQESIRSQILVAFSLALDQDQMKIMQKIQKQEIKKEKKKGKKQLVKEIRQTKLPINLQPQQGDNIQKNIRFKQQDRQSVKFLQAYRETNKPTRQSKSFKNAEEGYKAKVQIAYNKAAQNKPQNADDSASLQLLLLRQRMNKQTKQIKDGEKKLKQFEALRNSLGLVP